MNSRMRRKVVRRIEIKRSHFALWLGGWRYKELLADVDSVNDLLKDIEKEHYPEGPYCWLCDPDFGKGDGTDGNNPECPHKQRRCYSCGQRGVWPCRTRRLLDGEILED